MGNANTPTSIRSMRRGGFTLIELLVVIAIIAVLAGVGTIFLPKFTDNLRQNAQIETIDGAVRQAQLRAARTNTRSGVVFYQVREAITGNIADSLAIRSLDWDVDSSSGDANFLLGNSDQIGEVVQTIAIQIEEHPDMPGVFRSVGNESWTIISNAQGNPDDPAYTVAAPGYQYVQVLNDQDNLAPFPAADIAYPNFSQFYPIRNQAWSNDPAFVSALGSDASDVSVQSALSPAVSLNASAQELILGSGAVLLFDQNGRLDLSPLHSGRPRLVELQLEDVSNNGSDVFPGDNERRFFVFAPDDLDSAFRYDAAAGAVVPLPILERAALPGMMIDFANSPAQPSGIAGGNIASFVYMIDLDQDGVPDERGRSFEDPPGSGSFRQAEPRQFLIRRVAGITPFVGVVQTATYNEQRNGAIANTDITTGLGTGSWNLFSEAALAPQKTDRFLASNTQFRYTESSNAYLREALGQWRWIIPAPIGGPQLPVYDEIIPPGSLPKPDGNN